jgi:hypothetical protein
MHAYNTFPFTSCLYLKSPKFLADAIATLRLEMVFIRSMIHDLH